jgi:hypothetical protein
MFRFDFQYARSSSQANREALERTKKSSEIANLYPKISSALHITLFSFFTAFIRHLSSRESINAMLIEIDSYLETIELKLVRSAAIFSNIRVNWYQQKLLFVS